jgi:hypothetical protein
MKKQKIGIMKGENNFHFEIKKNNKKKREINPLKILEYEEKESFFLSKFYIKKIKEDDYNITLEIKIPKNQPDFDKIEIHLLNNESDVSNTLSFTLKNYLFSNNFSFNIINQTDIFLIYSITFFNIHFDNDTLFLDINLISIKGFFLIY